METLIDLLAASGTASPDRPAVAMLRGLCTDTWSYTRLWAASHAAAVYLRTVGGVQPGDRVLVRAPNSPGLVAAYFGCMLAGAVLVPLDDGSTADFVARVAAQTEARLLVTGADPAPAPDSLRSLPLASIPFAEHVPEIASRPRADDVAEIVFTSGTTGAPKGVVLTQANILADVRAGELAGVLPRSDRYRLLSLLPLSHMFEQTAGLFLPLAYGASVTYLPTRQPAVVFRALRRRQITGMAAVPLVIDLLWRGVEREVQRRGEWARWQYLLRVAERLPLAGRRLLFGSLHHSLGGHFEFFLCGGARLAPALEAFWERVGVRVIQGYGATECAPVIASNTYHRRVAGSVGHPVPGVQVRLSPVGEIQVQGANVMRGYWGDDTATRATFTDDGWYRTGDLAEPTRTGELVLRGRLRDLIVLANGLNVYPEDVEQVLGKETEVAECAVVGLADPDQGGPRVHAVIVPTPEAADPAARPRLDAAVRRANARLAAHQRVVDYAIWPAPHLPRTSSGKVQRQLLLGAAQAALPHAPAPQPAPSPDHQRTLADVVAEVAGVRPDAIRPDTDLSLDLHLESLARVELAVRLEEVFGLGVDERDLAQVHTMADLAALAARPSSRAPTVLAFPRWVRTRPAGWLRRAAQSGVLFPLQALLCRPFEVYGRESLDALHPPVLFVANHASHFDTPSVLRALPPRLRARTAVAAAADYFYRDAWLGGAASLFLNTFPFSREQDVRGSLDYCGELVDDGWSILLYPEGTRSPTGELQPFKGGIGLLARELKVPVVPVAVVGTHALLPKGRWLPRPGPVSVRFGCPILPDAVDDAAATTYRLQQAVAGLRGDVSQPAPRSAAGPAVARDESRVPAGRG